VIRPNLLPFAPCRRALDRIRCGCRNRGGHFDQGRGCDVDQSLGHRIGGCGASRYFCRRQPFRRHGRSAGEGGDGSCKTTVLDPGITLRPSIETTFHATLNWAVVATNIPSQRLPMRLP
jgi:hypothetical protein